MPVWVSVNLLLLMTAGLCFWSSLASLLPTMPLYIQASGGTQQQIGLVMGAFAIGLILGRPQLGSLADRHSRKHVLLIGLGVAALAPLGYRYTQSIGLLFALRAFHGLSVAAFSTAYTAFIVDFANPKDRISILGYTSLVTPIGVALGPILGGWLLLNLGYAVLFSVASLLAGIGFLCLLYLQDPSIQVNQQKQKQVATGPSRSAIQSFVQVFRLFLQPRLTALSLVMLCAGIIFGTLSTFMPLYMQQLGQGHISGPYYTIAAIASFAMRIVTGRVSRHVGKGCFITLSLICYGFSMVLLWCGTNMLAFLLSGALEGSGSGLLLPVMSAVVADRSAKDERGQVFSVCLGGFDMGIAFAGPLFGLLAPWIGLDRVFLGASMLSIVALVLFGAFGNQSPQRSIRFALGRGIDFYALPSRDR